MAGQARDGSHWRQSYRWLTTIVYTVNALHKFVKMAVAGAALCSTNQHTLMSGPITVRLRHWRFLLCWESSYSEEGANEVPQNRALRTTIVPSSCGTDTIKRRGVIQLFMELWKSSSGPKMPFKPCSRFRRYFQHLPWQHTVSTFILRWHPNAPKSDRSGWSKI